jgi:hypothetical protein
MESELLGATREIPGAIGDEITGSLFARRNVEYNAGIVAEESHGAVELEDDGAKISLPDDFAVGGNGEFRAVHGSSECVRFLGLDWWGRRKEPRPDVIDVSFIKAFLAQGPTRIAFY